MCFRLTYILTSSARQTDGGRRSTPHHAGARADETPQTSQRALPAAASHRIERNTENSSHYVRTHTHTHTDTAHTRKQHSSAQFAQFAVQSCRTKEQVRAERFTARPTHFPPGRRHTYPEAYEIALAVHRALCAHTQTCLRVCV